LQIGKLLAKGIPFSRDPANKTMCRPQLLRHHIEMAIQCADHGIVRHFRSREHRGGFNLYSTRSLERAGRTVRVLA